MIERLCRYCGQVFQPSKFHPAQSVCSGPECQRRRGSDSRHQKIASDPEYRQVCQNAWRKWCARHPDPWRQRRESNPSAVERNRQQQRVRDQKRRLRDLANNNSAQAQIWVLEALPPRRSPQSESCQQQRSGGDAISAG